MGAIDDCDRLRAFFSTRLQSYKWFMAVLFFILDTIINNAYYLWQQCATDAMKEQTSRRMWIAQLANEILEKYGASARDPLTYLERGMGGSCLPKTTDEVMLDLAADNLQSSCKSVDEVSLLHEHHVMITTETLRNCTLCYITGGREYGQRKTVTFCVQRQAALHKDCFQKWHLDEHPVSSQVCPK